MKNLITPLFLYRLPTYIFRDFIKVSGISMQNGQYVTYYDLMKHILKKGIPLIIPNPVWLSDFNRCLEKTNCQPS